MSKTYIVAVIIVAVMSAIVIGVLLFGSGIAPSNPGSPTDYTYRIIKTYPHDTSAFTEGLIYNNGNLYESTGIYGSSSLRRVYLESGNITKKTTLSSEFFGEGLTAADDSLIQLTWQNHIGFIYNKETFKVEGNFTYSSEGWGLTYDGKNLIMSDGSSTLSFLDPVSFRQIGQINVHEGNQSIVNVNELEYVNGDIYANIWMQQKIAIIDPTDGSVKGWIDLAGIYPNVGDSVLNGIAFDSQTNRLFVTGKNWPSLYQIQIVPATK